MSTRFHSKVQSTPGPRSPTTPTPSSSEEGSREFPSLDKEGSWVVDSVGRPFVFIDILALFPGIRSADLQVGMSAEQECWPEGQRYRIQIWNSVAAATAFPCRHRAHKTTVIKPSPWGEGGPRRRCHQPSWAGWGVGSVPHRLCAA